MIGHRENTCGYVGFECRGIPELKRAFMSTRMLCDTLVSRISEFEIPDTTDNYIDNYLNLPAKVSGFAMTVDNILDMQSNDTAAPEVSCIKNTDPFSTSGTFMDMFNKGNYSSRVNARVVNSTTGTGSWILMRDNLLCCGDGTLEPALLEPMLDTDFSPVGIEMNTSWDAGLDGVYIALTQFTKWRIGVDAFLNALGGAQSEDKGWMYLLSKSNEESDCKQFKITLVSGNSLVRSPAGNPQSPVYKVTGGTAKINGESINVQGIDNLRAEFTVYMNIRFKTPSAATGQYSTVEVKLDTKATGEVVFELGSVRRIQPKESEYTLFEIQQTRCDVDVDLIRIAKAGVVTRESSGKSPYGALDTAQCEE